MSSLEDIVGDAARFYTDSEPPLQQGDVVLAPVGRLQADPNPIPRWASFDQIASDELQIEDFTGLFALAGYGLAVVATHDCHMDREFNERVRELRRADSKLRLRDAEKLAEEDPDLDRFVNVCPLLPTNMYRAEWTALSRGEVIGAFPIPAPPAHADDLVADLTYRATIDRHAIPLRVGVMSDEARSWFRFSLARTDAFRTPTIGFELEHAVGKRIKAVVQHSANPLIVALELSDGNTIELVNQPAEVDTGGTSRKRSPKTA